MTAAVKALLEQAMRLSPEERAEVANALDGPEAFIELEDAMRRIELTRIRF